jgi:hypothetical protein
MGIGELAADWPLLKRRLFSPSSFASGHRWDRNFFLLMVALIWLGILMGFIPDVIRHVRTHEAAYPLVVHIHGVTFLAWLCLLTVQVLLIRAGNTDLHRMLGIAIACFAVVMVVIGVAAAVVANRARFGTPGNDPAFLSILLADLLSFTVLVSAAVALRNIPSAHKRLMILATICIANAGFFRWWGNALERLFGDGYWSLWAQLFLGDVLLIAVLGIYDLVTRRRLHPVYIFGVTWAVGFELFAVWLNDSPKWEPIARKLIGH